MKKRLLLLVKMVLEKKEPGKLNENTSKIVNFFKNRKIKKKDRIAAYYPTQLKR